MLLAIPLGTDLRFRESDITQPIIVLHLQRVGHVMESPEEERMMHINSDNSDTISSDDGQQKMERYSSI